MTIDEAIEALTVLKEKVGGDEEIPVVSLMGENDYITFSYPIMGNFTDQDGNEFKCAFIGDTTGTEFTRNDVPHYKWNPSEDKLDY